MDMKSELLAELAPDIVHVHNFFPILSPSIYDACQAAQIPVVQTLHNYRLVCPKAIPFRNDRICEDCFELTVPWPGVVHGCYRDSRVETAAVTAMLSIHRLAGTWERRVDAYIELPAAPVRGDFALFVGRLSAEKGVAVLLDAYLQHNLTLPLKIVGDGPLRDSLAAKAAHLPHVTFVGRQDPQAVAAMMQQAKFLVFPSTWYEGFPLTITEAFAARLPVIAANLGTMSEIIDDGVTGLHFESGNPTDLATKIQWAIAHPDSLLKMGETAYDRYQTCYTPDINYRQLLHIYKSALDR
jgi:glycosyltransferase involved in cell wall biosynthesis